MSRMAACVVGAPATIRRFAPGGLANVDALTPAVGTRQWARARGLLGEHSGTTPEGRIACTGYRPRRGRGRTERLRPAARSPVAHLPADPADRPIQAS